ncbi:anthranilate synthase component II [Phycisphaera mikurensis]|uniref:Para-aminobenzoate synthase glutamine amidotransferase component II n=1 Tax=Phycisphaera mikurensis (strain NBRC 102666 / KCTC 22515 / FYK2301M01) TaxID=1142394 RepID=I0IEP1_PHYMF|nr:aminodeoxychorismate/anthranilate synthase component II [Phycisphaera mikurensis]MBB6441527.1 anthranilate synthase/aminodeoxychorismate synthase-like glutamine amidotransferase [Phycisphaera mikurensis]BAM03729.1 para-aminobenzoate synthase glutamine amidotransferase component II [Phycisphaera mikurensis NBRC 102666]
MILLIDNYDSFTWNLVQRIGELLVAEGRDPGELPLRVVRNDAITADQAEALEPTHVIVSPGPCTPKEAGVSGEVIGRLAGKVPLLGVCLGHQAIGERHGMTVGRHRLLMHGKTSEISHDGATLFRGLPQPMTAMRYHSLVVDAATVDADRFEVSAWCDDLLPGDREPTRVVMGLRARAGVFGPAPLEGVQFHPESFMTPEGPAMLANFLGLPRPRTAAVAGVSTPPSAA